MEKVPPPPSSPTSPGSPVEAGGGVRWYQSQSFSRGCGGYPELGLDSVHNPGKGKHTKRQENRTTLTIRADLHQSPYHVSVLSSVVFLFLRIVCIKP